MLRGLCSAGLGALEGQAQLIQLAGRYGFQSVDLDALALIDQYGAEAAANLLADHKVSIGSIPLSVEWRQDEEQFLNDFKKLGEAAAAAKLLGCTRCCTYILPSTDKNTASFMIEATRRLRLCAQVLGAYGISLGLEFVGPHHLRTRWKHPFIWTLEDTLNWIAAIGEPNVGLLFDSYHWYTNQLTDSDILALRAEQIVHVHINDAKDVPIDEVLDNDRLYPGEGVIDLTGFLTSLNQIGYTGPVALEVLTPEQPTASPDELAARAKLAFDKVFGAAGIKTML